MKQKTSQSLTFVDERFDPRRSRLMLGRLLAATAVVVVLVAPLVRAVNERIVVPSAVLTAATATCADETVGSARTECVRGIFAQRQGTPEIAGR
jgi:hypothetical protein